MNWAGLTSPNSMRTTLLPEPGPRRVYAIATLVNTFGFGLVVTSLVLYLTRVVHLGSLQVGLGLTISGLIGLVAGVPVGALADRHGPRMVVRVTLLLLGAFFAVLGLTVPPSPAWGERARPAFLAETLPLTGSTNYR